MLLCKDLWPFIRCSAPFSQLDKVAQGSLVLKALRCKDLRSLARRFAPFTAPRLRHLLRLRRRAFGPHQGALRLLSLSRALLASSFSACTWTHELLFILRGWLQRIFGPFKALCAFCPPPQRTRIFGLVWMLAVSTSSSCIGTSQWTHGLTLI